MSHGRGPVYFISDTHIRDGEVEREGKLLSFLRYIYGRAEALYILGDLFDFWFEYRSVVPRTGWRVLGALHELVLSGTPVICIRGNHDFWLGRYITEEIGLRVEDGPIWVGHQGKRLFLAHGDEFLGDPGYRAFRYVLRHPVSVRLFRLLHPDVGAFLAETLSRTTKFVSVKKLTTVKATFLKAARRKFGEGADAVMFGHMHTPVLRRYGKRTFVVLGDWIRNFTYAEMEDGEVTLRRWKEGI